MYALFVLYITSRDLVRLSILLFYQRIFGRDPLAKPILFGCTPISYFWTSWDGEHEGHCISTNGIFWAGALVVIAIDIWVMLIPLPFIMKLKFSLRKKLLSGVMFTFGIFVVIVSLYRLKTITRFTLSRNPTADFVDVGIWSGLELYVGIICACLPNFHSLLKPVYARIGSFFASKTKGPQSASSGSRNSHERKYVLPIAETGPKSTTVEIATFEGKT
ncbi:hypothetical protein PFICI_06015 [Pestalotiopsis fici W106-1]|uniref:Rhodopsin domain-containing protein n=1 Tax=Pestalotiopsis fici (strain W106-1 / CGMCC3.15140) TaxID=1229662 RepID=W3X4E3_PESFW|nr:uncharacterized protein PFICI_06015 [Pestalotiopsis fici W106-1]ETS81013.1 hypothetical protein PFICI_06015 [Pestalotiopsis fici W106-1]